MNRSLKKTLTVAIFLLGLGLTVEQAKAQNEYGREAWMATFRTANAASSFQHSSSGIHRAVFNYAVLANQNVANAIDRPTKTNWYYATLWSLYTYYYAAAAYDIDMQRGYYLVPPKSAQVKREALDAFLACYGHYVNG